jgi:hypothetical protein
VLSEQIRVLREKAKEVTSGLGSGEGGFGSRITEKAETSDECLPGIRPL